MSGAPPVAGDLRVAIALDGDLPAGQAANVAACIAAGLAAALPGWAGQPMADADGFPSACSSNLPVPILRCRSDGFASLLERSRQRPDRAAVVVFPRYAQSLHDVGEYWQEHPARSLLCEPLLGMGCAGPARWVRSLTGALPLLR